MGRLKILGYIEYLATIHVDRNNNAHTIPNITQSVSDGHMNIITTNNGRQTNVV